MPKIVVDSDHAPDGFKTLSIGNAELDFSSGEVETTDPVVLSNAQSHPWLKVQHSEEESYRAPEREPFVRPEDDALSVENSVAFDEDKIRETEEAKAEAEADRVAIDAGKDQEKEERIHGVATTLAAAEADAADNEPAPEPRDDTTLFDTPEDNV